MRTPLAAAAVFLALPGLPEQGSVTAINLSAASAGAPTAIRILGEAPCSGLRIDFGDGQTRTVRAPQLPLVVNHTYARPGTYNVDVTGTGSCQGRVSTTMSVDNRGRNGGSGPEWGQRGAGSGNANERAQARQRFRGMDTNGDGAISRAEWRGSAQSFRVHDWNNDNVLSGTEIRELIRQEAGGVPGDFDETAIYDDWSQSRFTAMDANRDGRIARGEWTYDLESFRRVDRNRDNFVSAQEFTASEFDDDRGDRFDFLDVDGNNRVTRDEWHASDEAFAWLDLNRDNVLSRQEVEGEDAAAQSDLFARLDRNKDNRLSPQEWQWSRSSFDARDRDRDGVLTRRELAGDGFSEDPATATVTVGADTRWVDTGVSVLAGEPVRFQVSGTVQMSPDRSDVADPRGSRLDRRAPDAPLPQVPAGALIGRINQGAPFLIGDRASVTMPQTGRLQLSVNDDHLADNSGGFRVAVTVQR